jgi:hypothetical protein
VTLLAIFEQPEDVRATMDALRRAGFTDRELTVLSDVPYPEGTFGEEQPRHRLFVFPFIGAACGLAVGLLVTIGTQLSFPVVTGGKPLLSIPPMINVLYEATLLGAIVFTVAGVIFESRLPDLSGLPADTRISDGCLGLVVRSARQDEAVPVLRQHGAIDIREASA